MKIQYLGTAAFEGIPSLFCNCEVCRKSRQAGGRAIRTRSQALIDGRLLIDFNGDTVCHCQTYGIDMQDVAHCLITHAHSDHLYAADLNMLGCCYAHPKNGYTFSVYASDNVTASIKSQLEPHVAQQADLPLTLHNVEPFESFPVGDYHVVAYPAYHDPAAGPLFYQISDGQKTMLYAHDSGYFLDSVWAYFREHRPHFDFVSLDCTSAGCSDTGMHMGLKQNADIRKRMLTEGYADENTIFVSNHFSHNGASSFYDDFVPLALQEGLLTSYDGMTVCF